MRAVLWIGLGALSFAGPAAAQAPGRWATVPAAAVAMGNDRFAPRHRVVARLDAAGGFCRRQGRSLWIVDTKGGVYRFDLARQRGVFRSRVVLSPGSPPEMTAAGGVLLLGLGGAKPRVVALDGATGKRLWSRSGLTLAGRRPEARLPVFAEGFTRLVGLQLRTGRLRWRLPSGAGRVTAGPASRRFFTFTRKHALLEVDGRTGKIYGRWPLQLPVASPAAVGGATVAFLLNYPGAGRFAGAVDLKARRLAWRRALGSGGPSWLTPVVGGGLVWLRSEDGRLWAWEAATGKERWSTRRKLRASRFPLIVSAGVVLYQHDQRTLFARDLRSGKRRFALRRKRFLSLTSRSLGVGVSGKLAAIVERGAMHFVELPSGRRRRRVGARGLNDCLQGVGLVRGHAVCQDSKSLHVISSRRRRAYRIGGVSATCWDDTSVYAIRGHGVVRIEFPTGP